MKSDTLPYNAAMRRLLLLLAAAALSHPSHAQNATAASELEAILKFETAHSGTSPGGWTGGPEGTIVVDGQIVHGGRWSVRLERDASSPNGFSTITKAIPMDFTGVRIEWRGFLRSEGVSNYLGLWMREDGDTPGLAFENMQQRQVHGTHDWTEYSITLPVHRDAKQLYVGVLVAGTGKVWADDLQLLVDGKPVWEAPKVERPKTSIDLDHEFDGGSGIALSELTPAQIENLTTLGKIWGFLKYHHQGVIAGKYHWDYELFRVLPAVLTAGDRQTANAAIRNWVRRLGVMPACKACMTLGSDADLYVSPDVDWIRSEAALGSDLNELLRSAYRDRPGGKQFYVSQAPGVGNPVFEHELAYAGLRFPDAGYQLLALYRFWNIIAYWYPNRDVLDVNWGQVLAQFIPRIALAKSRDAYQLETIALIATVTDTHANLWNAPPQLRPPSGECQLPVTARFIENRAVVTGYSQAAGATAGLRVGDVIESLDGVPVEDLLERWAPYYPASNRPARLRDIARAMTRGACSTAHVGIRRATESVEIRTQRQPLLTLDQTAGSTHDLPGDTFQLLSDQVAYLKLSSVRTAQASSYVDRAKGTKGLVIDIRNYPSEFVVFALGSLLVDQPMPFARFTIGDLDNPGAFRWRGEPLTLNPQQPHYSGKIVILVDEISQSQAEYTAMAFRAAPQAMVVGSTTAGADGNVSQVSLPGGLRTMISGIGVFYPDKRPTQRVGIVPDVEMRPTIAGIRAGRDEVLEEALRQILGRQTPADQIERMARPRL
jgi:C-terminal processing protease CtpA/Prc